jgi:hypothetical protein
MHRREARDHERWAEAVGRRYRRQRSPALPLGTVLVSNVSREANQTAQFFRTDVHVSADHRVTYRGELRVTPRVDLTVALHRHEVSQLVQRLLTRTERQSMGPRESTVAMAANRGARVPDRRFEPVPLRVRTNAPAPGTTDPATARPPEPGLGWSPASRPAWHPSTGQAEQQVPIAPIVPKDLDLDRLTERVIRAIDRRVIAQRERQGRA